MSVSERPTDVEDSTSPKSTGQKDRLKTCPTAPNKVECGRAAEWLAQSGLRRVACAEWLAQSGMRRVACTEWHLQNGPYFRSVER